MKASGANTEGLHLPLPEGKKSPTKGTNHMIADTSNNPIAELVESHKFPAINQALPTWAVDLLDDGIYGRTTAQKAWGELVRLAMSAQNRGWSEVQFKTEVTERKTRRNRNGQKRYRHHGLWEQLLQTSKDEKKALRSLDRAWDQAGFNLMKNNTLRTTADLVADAIEKAFEWSDRLDADTDKLNDTQKAVLRYVAASVEKRQMSRVTCPSQALGDLIGVSAKTANRTLHWLQDRGFLDCFHRGVRSANESLRKAAIYSLSDPSTLRAGGHIVEEKGVQTVDSLPESEGRISNRTPPKRPKDGKTSCKHCGLQITLKGQSWVHVEGDQAGKHTCALDPYGYGAAPIGAPCERPCSQAPPP